jgi:hypothetical protein
LKGKLTNDRIRYYRHVLRMNVKQISKNVMNTKEKENVQEGDLDQDGNNRLGRISHTTKNNLGRGALGRQT